MDELQPGDPQWIGPYWLEGRLGSGGMGRVYLGRSPGGRPVAIKVIRAELAEDAEFRARFAREVSAARKVSGIYTAPVVDADPDGPMPWLATSYVAGPSLAGAVADRGPLPPASVLRLAAGLAEGLDAIHSEGVVHRDLKPSNVLLAEDGPRLIDFGICRSVETGSLTRTGMVVGSPGFMAPEQAEGHEVGPPSDIFSLGAVLTFAATGEGPFGEASSAALLYRVVCAEPNIDGLPAEIRALIGHCLAKHPQDRPTAAQLLAVLSTVQLGARSLPEPAIGGLAGPGPADLAPGEAAMAMTPPRLATARAASPNLPLRPAPSPAAPPEPTATAGPVRPDGSEAVAASGYARPWAPGGPGSAGPHDGHGRFSRNAITGVLAAAVLVLAGSVAALTLSPTSAPAAVALEAVGTPGANPFMPPVGTDQPGLRLLPGSGGTFSGATPGLYGGTMRKASCNPQQLVSFLHTHPDKAAAWASVLGIRPADIPGYVAGLTSAVLRSDTAVTNHGYIDGHVTSFPAVLEAGTAVLIDRYGQPVTKCFCGNPLTKPMAYTQLTYTGRSWSSFSPTSVTYIQKTTTPTSSLTLVNPVTGAAFRRAPGSSRNADQPLTTPPQGSFTIPAKGSPTTQATGSPAVTPTTGPPATPTTAPPATPTTAPPATPTTGPPATPTTEPPVTPTTEPPATPTTGPSVTPTTGPPATPTTEAHATPTTEAHATPTTGPLVTPTTEPPATSATGSPATLITETPATPATGPAATPTTGPAATP